MNMTLGKKLFLYTGVTLALVLLLVFATLERVQSRQWEEFLRSQSVSFARISTPEILKQFRGAFPPDSRQEFSRLNDLLGMNKDLVRFAIYSPSGRVLFESPLFPDFIDLPVEQVADRAGLLQRLQVPRTTLLTRELSDGSRLLDLATPAFGPTGEQVLTIRYLISYDSVDRRLAATRRQYLWIGLAALAGALLLAALVARRVTRPIVELIDGVRAIERGEMQVRIASQGSDEIAALANAFNDMGEGLQKGREALTEKNRDLEKANAALRQMQEQLVRSERLAAIGQLAAGVSHEIDNPVGIILGYAELLLEDCPAGDPRRDDLEAIIAECRRCKRITGGLLGFARSESGELESVDVELLVLETLASLQPQKLFKDISTRVDVAEGDLLPVRGDRDQLRQVLVNLLLNSAQAMDGNGALQVGVGMQGDMVCLTVTDNGPGVPAELQEKIFEPFFSTKQSNVGTGLGLSLCRKLVEDHGGELRLEPSTGPGATFRLLLPGDQA